MVEQSKIDEVIQKTDIVDLVSEFIPLEKYGSGFRGLCPFHPDHSPSFSVSPEKKIAKCMVCGEGGNPITFLRKIKNISFNEALKELADKVGIQIDGLYIAKKSDTNQAYYDMMETSKKFYIHNLLNTKSGLEAIKYLNSRGIDDEAIKRFEIGLSLNTSSSLYQILKEQNYNELDMLHLGLIKENDDGFYDLFRNRIMFPIKDEFGHTIAYSARLFQTDDKTQAKYVNSPETILFKKHLTLYHLSDALMNIRQKHRVILHEGQIDVIQSVLSGNDEAICTMGTALTKDHVRIIKKYTDNVLLCYDGDKAGIEAMLKSISLLESANLKIKLVILPDDDDPDSFIRKHGKDSFNSYLENNQLDPLDFIFKYATKDHDFTNNSDVEDAKQKLFTNLKNIKQSSTIERYIGLLAKLINVSTSSLLMDFNQYYTPPSNSNYADILDYNTQNSNLETPNQILANYAWAELRLLNYARLNKSLVEKIESAFPENDIRPYLEPIHQDLWDELTLFYYMKYDNFLEQQFLKHLDERLTNCYLKNVQILEIKGDKFIPYNDIDMECCINVIKEHFIEKQAQALDAKIATASGSDKILYLTKKVELLKKLDKERTLFKQKHSRK